MKLLNTLSLLVIGAYAQKKSPQIIAQTKLASALDKFLKNEADNGNKNYVYSPVSAYSILAALYMATGDDEDSRSELREKFSFPARINTKGFAEKLAKLTVEDKAVKTFNNYILHTQDLADKYAESLEIMGFQQEYEATFVGKTDKYNAMIEKDTDGLIKDYFSPGQLDSVALMLMNTILFDAKWHSKTGVFNELKNLNIWEHGGKTHFQKFMVSEQKTLRYWQANDVTYVSMPFENGVSWFTVAMPNEAGLSPWDIEWNTKLRQELININKNLKQVKLYFPEFKFESEVNLVEFLKAENADSLFVEGAAGLTKMFKSREASKSAYVNGFQQKAIIDCNQSGVKAAAVTVATTMIKSAAPNLASVEINKPFKFFIHNNRADKVYFQGVVQCPGNNC